jgi:hypothetical protein
VIHDPAEFYASRYGERVTFAKENTPSKVKVIRSRSTSPMGPHKERLTPKRRDDILFEDKVVAMTKRHIEEYPDHNHEESLRMNRDPHTSYYTQATPLSMNTTVNSAMYTNSGNNCPVQGQKTTEYIFNGHQTNPHFHTEHFKQNFNPLTN